jgi:acetamidase/formamidase
MSTVTVTSDPGTILWGRLPCGADRSVACIDSGDIVRIDTVSHEGILEDQGQNPVEFFGAHGISPCDVDPAAIEIARSATRQSTDGPHVVTGPIRVNGARPGDRLAVTIIDLSPRLTYGIISSRHHKGALPQRFPDLSIPVDSVFCQTEGLDRGFQSAKGVLPLRRNNASAVVRFPLSPFLGLMGVATVGTQRPHSTPPRLTGGNLDVALFGVGSTVFFPVEVDGAGFFVGDPHFAQGDGEIALTAFEAPLQATLRLSVMPAAEAAALSGVQGPFGVTDDFLVPTGLDSDLNLAVEKCAENALELLSGLFGMEPAMAYAYMSAATNFGISQVVDQVKGVHGSIRLSDFADTTTGPHPLGSLPPELARWR